jgi:hypothetical protein
MKYIDFDNAWVLLNRLKIENNNFRNLLCEALREKELKDRPQPLSPDKLDKREQQPIWIDFGGEHPNGWFIPERDWEGFLYIWYCGNAMRLRSHWKYYDHKPTEITDNEQKQHRRIG